MRTKRDASGNATQWGVQIPASGFPYWLFQGLTTTNDVRLMNSGPRCGLGEVTLPAIQPGSSIMPGKVNPVIAESLLMACAQVIGYDATITWCCAAGNFELNVMMPVMAYDLLESIELLAASARNFDRRAIQGLEADVEKASGFVEQSLAMCTVLAPVIGYEKAAAIAKEAYRTGRTVREDFADLWRELEWMGLQRHLKVLGIFCRLKHRDGKPKYSEDLPRFFRYAHKVSARYNALRPLSRLLEPLMGAQRVDAYY